MICLSYHTNSPLGFSTFSGSRANQLGAIAATKSTRKKKDEWIKIFLEYHNPRKLGRNKIVSNRMNPIFEISWELARIFRVCKSSSITKFFTLPSAVFTGPLWLDMSVSTKPGWTQLTTRSMRRSRSNCLCWMRVIAINPTFEIT